MLRTMSDTPGGGEPAPAPAPDAPYPLRYLAGVLWQYRWLIVSVTATGSALVLIYLILSLILPDDLNPLPDVYRAEALLLVPRDASTPNFDSYVPRVKHFSALHFIWEAHIWRLNNYFIWEAHIWRLNNYFIWEAHIWRLNNY